MSRLIIGSTAIKKHFPDFREPRDLDFALRSPDHADYHKNTPGVEYYWMPSLWSAKLKGLYATPDMLYTMSLSLKGFIEKETLDSDIEFLKSKGCEVIPDLLEILKKRWKTHGAVN